jgi:RHS repeat-associated protein
MPKRLFPLPFHIVHTGDAKTDRLYTGQRWDALTGVYDYGARHYDPRLARFLSHDPVREYINPYAYVRWNPVMYFDNQGQSPVLAAVFLAVATVAIAGFFGGINASLQPGGSFITGFAGGATTGAVGVALGLAVTSVAGFIAVAALGGFGGGVVSTGQTIAGTPGGDLASGRAIAAMALNGALSAGISAAGATLGALSVLLFEPWSVELVGFADVLSSYYGGVTGTFLSSTMSTISGYGVYGFPSGGVFGGVGLGGIGAYVGFFWPGGGPGPGPGLGGGGGGFGPGPSGAAPSPPGPSAPPAGCQGTCTVFESPGPPQGPPPPAQEPEGPGGPSPGPIFTYPLI